MPVGALAANVTARKVRVYIGADDQEWSSNAGRFTSNKASIGEDGVCAYQASLEIKNLGYLNPENVDPEANPARWRPGQRVRVQVPDDAGSYIPHPQGYLFILSEPAPDGNLTLQLGDWLVWGDSQEPADDVSAVNLGVAEDVSVIAQRYLEAAGIPSTSINLAGPWGYEVALPVTKESGSFVSKAGELAYAAGFRVLYQDKNGIVQVKQVNTSAKVTPDLTLDLATAGMRFDPLIDPQEPFEIIKVAGVGETVEQIDSSITSLVPGDTSDVYTEEKWGTAAQVLRGTTGPSYMRRLTRLRVREDAELVWESGNGGAIKVVTGDSTEILYYENLPDVTGSWPKRHFWTSRYMEKAAGIIDGDESSLVERFREEYLDIEHDADGRVSKVTESVWEREKAYKKDGGIGWRKTRETVQQWIKKGTDLYAYRSTEKAAKIVIDLQTATRGTNEWRLVDSRPPEFKPAKRGENQPPAADEWQGPYTISTQDYEGQVTWAHRGGATGRNRTRVFQLPNGLAFSEAQCVEIAGKHRDLLAGRKRGRLIQLPLSTALLALDEPDPQIRVTTLDGWVRTYLLDSIGFEHQPTKAFCQAAGILVAEVAP